MAKRTNSVDTTFFSLELLRRIPRSQRITAQELHQQLTDAGIERNVRTIQRQLERLSQHFDLECDDRCRPYGWRWRVGSRGLSMAQLSPAESLLMQMAQAHLKHLLPAHLMASFSPFFSQAGHTLSHSEQAQREREWSQKVRVVAASQPLLPPVIQEGVFDAVSEALYYNRWLNIDYSNAHGTRRQVEVMPLGLAQQGSRLYLVCRFKGYDNERSLALNRITSAVCSTFHFSRPTDFNLKRYDDDGRFGFGEGRHIRIHFTLETARAQLLLESPLSSDQQVSELDDGRLRFSATVVDSPMLDGFLATFGNTISNIKRDIDDVSTEQENNDEYR
ncbi:helix-turn-helix transcriptional regulator [Enterobacter roggenkampii]|uniref:helix-turn-helix transcriptional regulator n=1 Tax=Enterobacter roggenkampii TaxID=1812935 RepID=UPI00352640D0